jgi:hypothetical protein
MSKPDAVSKTPIFDQLYEKVQKFADQFRLYPFKYDKDTSELANPDVEVLSAMFKTLFNVQSLPASKLELKKDDPRLQAFVLHFQKKTNMWEDGDNMPLYNVFSGAKNKENYAQSTHDMRSALETDGN